MAAKQVPSITEDDWDVHRYEIERKYIREGKKLEDVMAHMERYFAFRASKQQYVRKLKKWDSRKNAKAKDWASIGLLVQKRQVPVEDVVVNLHGCSIPHKRLRKELSRYTLPSFHIQSLIQSPYDLSLHGYVSVHIGIRPTVAERPPILSHTLPALRQKSLACYTVPSFKLDDMFARTFDELRIAFQASTMPTSLYGVYYERDQPESLFGTDAHRLTDYYASHQSSRLSQERNQTQSASECTANDNSSEFNPCGTVSQIQLPEQVALEIMEPENDGYRDRYEVSDVDELTQHLRRVVLEGQPVDQMEIRLDKLRELSSLDAILQWLHYCFLLVANDLLIPCNIVKVLSWSIQVDIFPYMRPFLCDNKSVSMEKIRLEFFLAAASMDDMRIMMFFYEAIRLNDGFDTYTISRAMIRALQPGTLAQAIFLIGEGADVNAFAGGEYALLKIVRDINSVPLAKRLIENGADVNVGLEHSDIGKSFCYRGDENRPRYPNNPCNLNILLHAIKNDNHEMVQLLLDAGIDPNIFCHCGTALQRTAYTNNVMILRTLLLAGAVVDAPTGSPYLPEESHKYESDWLWSVRYKMTALHIAAKAEYLEAVDELLKAGANVNPHPWTMLGSGWLTDTTLTLAVRTGNIALAKRILEAGARVNDTEGGEHALVSAARQLDIRMVQLLLHYGAKIDLRSPGHSRDPHTVGSTPLQVATSAISASRSDMELLAILLGAGANINAAASPCREGMSCLQVAARHGYMPTIQYLLDEGAYVNAPAAAFCGRTALQSAIEAGHGNVARALLDAGADANAMPSPRGGITSLSAAIKHKSYSLVDELLRKGADPNLRYLNEVGTPEECALITAIRTKQLEMVKKLLHQRADINPGYPRYCPLVTAIEVGEQAIIEELIGHGADINPTCPAGHRLLFISRKSPLEAAAATCNTEVVKTLLGRGACVNPTGSHVFSIPPLHAAVHAAVERNKMSPSQALRQIDLVKTLLLHGADPNWLVWSDLTISVTDKVLDLVSTTPPGATRIDELQWKILFQLLNAGTDLSGLSCCNDPIARCALLKRLIETAVEMGGWHNHRVQELIVLTLIEAGISADKVSCPLYLETTAKSLRMEINVQHIQKWEGRPNINSGPYLYHKALSDAAYNGDYEFCQFLLDGGADLASNSELNSDGSRSPSTRPLNNAVLNGHFDTSLLLLDRGANPNTQCFGATALQVAVEQNFTRIVILLLEWGADINAPGERTALEVAASHGRLDIMHLLLENDHDLDELKARCTKAAVLAKEKNPHMHKYLLRYPSERLQREGRMGVVGEMGEDS